MTTETRPTFIRTDKGTEKLLTQEANGLALKLQYIVVSNQKFEPTAALVAVPGALEPVAIGTTKTDLARMQKTLGFSLPVTMGDLRINAVGILDEDFDLIYVWSSTDADESLGYKEVGSRYLQGLVLKILDSPFDSVEVIDDGSLADVDLSFVDLEDQQAVNLLTTMLAVGELGEWYRTQHDTLTSVLGRLDALEAAE